ncbi:MAG: hypothetical protein R6U44_02885 [Archaeoglobaceae archaeon]
MELEEIDKDYENIKFVILNKLIDSEILDCSKENEMYKIEIKDDDRLYLTLKLFFYFYVLEKLYSQEYPPTEEKASRRHFKSIIPKDKQAYIMRIGDKTLFLTYFKYHDIHINPFYLKKINVGDFKKAFKELERPSHINSPGECPCILLLKYHVWEKINIINGLDCNLTIDFSDFKCNKNEGDCNCLEEIEGKILEDPENRECNLRIFGGSPVYFDLDYEIPEEIISLEEVEYEPLFNFLLGCYIAGKLELNFNSNIGAKIDSNVEEFDVIFHSKNSIITIENTREHGVCGEKDKEMKKLKRVIEKNAPFSTITDYNNLKCFLLTFTPEHKFTSGALENFVQLFSFKHIGLPEETSKYIINPKYFSPKNVEECLNHHIDGITSELKVS